MNNYNTKQNDISFDEEIDLTKIKKRSFRNKTIVSVITFLGTSLAIFSTYINPAIYRGSFEIVLEDKNEEKTSSISINPGQLFSSKSLDNDLNTKIFILKSPLVLKPVYEYFKNKNLDAYNSISYKSWIDSFLEIEIEPGSSLLRVQYKDIDKEEIINVLEKISRQYQQYSMSARQFKISQGINFLEKQIKIKAEKSYQSLMKLNKFSIENGLGTLDGFYPTKNNDFLNNLNVDSISSLSVLAQPGQNGFENSVSSDSGAGDRYKGLFRKLEIYEIELAELSSRLKPESQVIKDLQLKIQSVKNSLKRPNEILLEFRTLRRISSRDENTMINLEDQLNLLKLEKAKNNNPWEIITKPTLEDHRIYPRRKKIAIVSFLISFFVAVSLANMKEILLGNIYELSDLKKLIKFNFLFKLFKKEPELNSSRFNKIIENINPENKKCKLGLFSNIKDFKYENFFKKSNLKDVNIINKLKSNEFDKYSKILILIEEGSLKRKDIELYNEYFSFFSDKVLGWIYLNKN